MKKLKLKPFEKKAEFFILTVNDSRDEFGTGNYMRTVTKDPTWYKQSGDTLRWEQVDQLNAHGLEALRTEHLKGPINP